MGKRKTHEYFLSEVFESLGNEFTILEEYKGVQEKITVRHNCDKCNNYEWETTPNSLLTGTKCPKCSKRIKNKTTEYFKKEVIDLYGDEYEVLGEYKGNNKKIKIKHNLVACGFEYETTPSIILGGSRCPKCYGTHKKTQDEFKEEVFNLERENYLVIGEYTNNSSKIEFKHAKCGNNFNMSPNAFLQGQRCSFCKNIRLSNSLSKQHSTFVEEVEIIYGNEYKVLSKYKNSETKVKILHVRCDSEWMSRPADLLKGSGCPVCSRKNMGINQTKSNEEFLKQINDKYNAEYTILETYISANTKIKVLHNKCGNIINIRPSSLLNNHGCEICGRKIAVEKQTKTTEQFKKDVYSLVDNEYTVLGKYKTNKVKILMKHNSDRCSNYEWEIKPITFLNGGRCPVCAESKGEQKVRYFLEDNNIRFTPQYIYEDLKDQDYLRFDFAIKDVEDNIVCLVEYDGEFHYLPIVGKKNLKYTQYHDQLKNEYCMKNNIPLIRIPYWDFDNIEQILTTELQKHNLI